MKLSYRPDLVANAILFALIPAAAAAGGLAMALLVCVAGALSFRPSHVRQVVENRPAAVWLLLAFGAWVIASSAWSPHPDHRQAYKLAAIAPLGLMFVGAATADPRARRLTMAGGLAAFVVLALLIGVEAAFGMPLNRAAQPDLPLGEIGRNASRGATTVLALTWGVAGGLVALGGRARWAGAVLVLAASAALSLQFDQLSNAVGFGLGLAAFLLAFALPRVTIALVTGGLAFWMLAAPFLTPLVLGNQRLVDALPLSWAARAGIWDYVCGRIMEQPWIGHGLDASRAVTDRIQIRDQLDMRGVPLHPHSASLHVWFETGAVGAVLAAATLLAGGYALIRAYGDNRPAAAAACATLAALGLIANVSFGAWQEWWNATMFVAAALVGAISLRDARA